MKKCISWGYSFRGTCLVEPINFGPYEISEVEMRFFKGSSIKSALYTLESYATTKNYPDFCPIKIEGVYKITGVQIEIILESFKIHKLEVKRMMDLLGWDYNNSETPSLFFAIDEAVKTCAYQESLTEDKIRTER